MDTTAALVHDRAEPALSERAAVPPFRLSWLMAIALACGFAATAFVIVAGRIVVRFSDFVPFIVLAAVMALVAAYCDGRRLEPRVRDAAAMIAVGTLALLACGLVSNMGLRLGMPLVDGDLAAIDAFFGIDVGRAVRAFAGHPALITALSYAYNFSPPAVILSIAIALFAGRRALAWEMVATLVVSMQVVAIVSVLLPAIGAMHHFGLEYLQGNGLPRGAGIYHLAAFETARSGLDPVFGIEDMAGLVTFPSFHTVLALMLAQALAPGRLKWLGVAASAVVIVSTIPIGGHYVIDLVAGFAIWAGCAALARRFNSPSG